MNYSSVLDFFGGAYLDIRHPKVLESIRHHTDFATRDLLTYLDINKGKLPYAELAKINAYMTDLSEVFFMCENLHIYVIGMDKVTSTQEELEKKTVEVKNQSHWIRRHLPSMWDGVIILTRFHTTFGKYLTIHPEIKLHYFEAINPAICDMSRAPFSFLKLKSILETDHMTSAILASALAGAVTQVAEAAIDLGIDSGKVFAKIQAHAYEKIHTSVFGLISEYEKGAVENAPMGETEEALRLIDELEQHIKQLRRDFVEAFDNLKKQKQELTAPTLDPEVYHKAVTTMYDKMRDIIQRRLG